MQLTKQQTRVYSYLETYLRRKGRPPSYQEIQDYFGFRSLNSVVKHLKQLERKGYLESPWGNQKRAFRLLPLRTTAATIPFLGRVAAGAPIEAVDIPEAIEVPESLLAGGNNFALQVQGESMIDEGIRDGDVLIIRKQNHADNGQTVVAQIEGVQCVWIESEGKRACFISDLVPTQAHLPFPWIMAFDLYPMDTLASKKRLLPQLAEDRVLVVFPHDAEVPWGTLVESEGKLMFQPVAVT